MGKHEIVTIETVGRVSSDKRQTRETEFRQSDTTESTCPAMMQPFLHTAVKKETSPASIVSQLVVRNKFHASNFETRFSSRREYSSNNQRTTTPKYCERTCETSLSEIKTDTRVVTKLPLRGESTYLANAPPFAASNNEGNTRARAIVKSRSLAEKGSPRSWKIQRRFGPKPREEVQPI